MLIIVLIFLILLLIGVIAGLFRGIVDCHRALTREKMLKENLRSSPIFICFPYIVMWLSGGFHLGPLPFIIWNAGHIESAFIFLVILSVIACICGRLHGYLDYLKYWAIHNPTPDFSALTHPYLKSIIRIISRAALPLYIISSVALWNLMSQATIGYFILYIWKIYLINGESVSMYKLVASIIFGFLGAFVGHNEHICKWRARQNQLDEISQQYVILKYPFKFISAISKPAYTIAWAISLMSMPFCIFDNRFFTPWL